MINRFQKIYNFMVYTSKSIFTIIIFTFSDFVTRILIIHSDIRTANIFHQESIFLIAANAFESGTIRKWK